MESDKKVKVSVVVKFVSDKQDKEIADSNSDGFLVLSDVKRVLNAVALKNEEEDESKLLHLLNAAKLSHEIMANAFIDVNRDDLFTEEIGVVSSIDDVIKLIKNL